MKRLIRHAVVQQEVPSDRSGKRPEEPRLLKAITMYASCYHELNVRPKIVRTS